MEQKMYWKNGFYDVPIDGAVEITKRYWQELLDGQSAGLVIVENEKGYPILKGYEPTLLELKARKIAELQAYDSSESVNSFSIGNVSGWLNKSTRVGLMNSISIERESGHINAINQLETKEEIEAYNFKTGYPGKLSFFG
ncbi:MAG: hypothetical protein BHV74_00100 [Bacteroides finegoldii]|nr:MAG: hypothetical protein BHV74_00100 [Bacteroides finegoldii]